MTETPTKLRTFLFLQDLASGFFARLGRMLASRGHGVVRVNLNAGDWASWRQPGAVNFRGRPNDWPDFVANLIATRGITDIVLFGDCRPMHRRAIEVATRLCLAVHVVEEGYLRPDWVTIEQDGVNGHSSLPRDPAWFRDAALALPPVEPVLPVAASFARRAREDIVYNFSAMLLWWAYPHYVTHRPWHPMVEYAGWAWRLLHHRPARRRSNHALRRMHDGAAYFLFPLQLDCDSQIRLHSSFSGMAAAIETVLTSFARFAPAAALLVVKEHPLDNGLVNWRRLTLAAAEQLGLSDRLIYLEVGDIAQLVQDAAGVVTVNSTTGTLALACGVPVITLGSAIYALQGLTFEGVLDQFWTNPTPPDAALFDAFRRVLVKRCLVRGGFFSEQGLDMLVDGAVARLEAVTPIPARHGRERAALVSGAPDIEFGSASVVASLQR